MPHLRHSTIQLQYGSLKIGGDAPVAVQSMTNTPTQDVQATGAQIRSLAGLGCELVRVAVPDRAAALALRELSALSPIPVVADIHFDPDLAVLAAENGAAGLRVNPGNICGMKNLRRVVDAAKAHGLPIRVGANSGSLPPELKNRPEVPALVTAVSHQVTLLEKLGFEQIKVSLKSSSVTASIAAGRAWSTISRYPLHLGVTEAGGVLAGAIKSSLGIGALLLEGVGNTLRISLSAPPEEEVKAAWHLLRACGLRRRGVEIISCPTCGRTGIDLLGMLKRVENELAAVATPLTVAVMGCVVNGPGEASHADVGIAGGKGGKGALFVKGKVVKSLPEGELLEALLAEVKKLISQEADKT
jgi:(E)-4-hydroxy-3-methylbut-2-enyl-diphosphate synthase